MKFINYSFKRNEDDWTMHEGSVDHVWPLSPPISRSRATISFIRYVYIDAIELKCWVNLIIFIARIRSSNQNWPVRFKKLYSVRYSRSYYSYIIWWAFSKFTRTICLIKFYVNVSTLGFCSPVRRSFYLIKVNIFKFRGLRNE